MEAFKPQNSPIKASSQLHRLPISPISPSHDIEEEGLELVPIGRTTENEHEPLLGDQEEASSATKPLAIKPQPYDPHLEKTSPLRSRVSSHNYDEEKLKPAMKRSSTKLTSVKYKQRIFDLTQRAITLALSIVVLGIMSHAYLKFRANMNVTVDGTAIYPEFMNLWPTYMMIAAGVITVILNAAVFGWRIHGSVNDFHHYALHGINGIVWLATSFSFGLTKNWGPAADPNVLWGYVCSPTASNLTETYPQIIKFYVQCELQNVSFWTAVSSVMVEVFAVATKLFVK